MIHNPTATKTPLAPGGSWTAPGLEPDARGVGKIVNQDT
jgi:hypothetical protein